MNRKQLIIPLAGALFAALALTACDRNDGTTVGQKVDSAGSQMAEAGRDAKATTGEAVRNAGKAVSDAAITASVNAELAKDPALSALKIDVDTSNGRVALKGTAPDQAARDRATQLAQGVDGVTAVDNQLTVKKS